ncbi:hypothetical protein B0J14DRAFT_609262 [Halenospora varia]|nr:hypothetical protein B0J14DRAFT_609262 [Halenospora varia]
MPRTHIVDLAHSSSPLPPPSRRKAPSKSQKASSARSATRDVPVAVEKVIQTLSESKLRFLVQSQLRDNPIFVNTIENLYLVKGKNIIRYHEDTESEDRGESEESELGEFSDADEDVESEDADAKAERKRREKVILVEDEEVVPKNAICENCKEEFELDGNERGDCVWHPGHKELNDEEDFWADHDPDCHGDPESFIDDSDFAEGFIWTCCDKAGDADGCKETKHKNKQNIVRARVPSPSPVPTPRKRKAERVTAMVRCATCNHMYDGNDDEEIEGCRFHPGYKKVSDKAEHWCDWDELRHGYCECFVDDPEHAEGFEWSCCGEISDKPGCELQEHTPASGGKRRRW